MQCKMTWFEQNQILLSIGFYMTFLNIILENYFSIFNSNTLKNNLKQYA